MPGSLQPPPQPSPARAPSTPSRTPSRSPHRSPASRSPPRRRSTGADRSDGEDYEKVVDYFAVIGPRPRGDLELLDEEQNTPDMLRCVWEASITDIAVVCPAKGESCPDGYEIIERTPNGNRADLNHGSMQRAVYLAVQRQHVSRRSDYIADVQVLFTQYERLPATEPGWELITRSVSGKKAKLNKGGDHAYLAVRRVARDALDCPPAVVNVCVVLRNKDETAPHGWHLLERDLNKGKFGDVVYLAYELGPPFSIARLPYRSEILDRYPDVDNPVFPFPQDQLPMFVYPKGMLLEHREAHDTPKPTFFSFVFTNIDGRRTYAACLTFYEPLLPSDVRRLNTRLGLDELDDCSSSGGPLLSRRNTVELAAQRRVANNSSQRLAAAAAAAAATANNNSVAVSDISLNATGDTSGTFGGGGGGGIGGSKQSGAGSSSGGGGGGSSGRGVSSRSGDGSGAGGGDVGLGAESGSGSADGHGGGSNSGANTAGAASAGAASAGAASARQNGHYGPRGDYSSLLNFSQAANGVSSAALKAEAAATDDVVFSLPRHPSTQEEAALAGEAVSAEPSPTGPSVVEAAEIFRSEREVWRDEDEAALAAAGGTGSGPRPFSLPRLHRRGTSSSSSAVDHSWRMAVANGRGGGARRSGSNAGVALAAAAVAAAEESARVAAGDAESRAAAYAPSDEYREGSWREGSYATAPRSSGYESVPRSSGYGSDYGGGVGGGGDDVGATAGPGDADADLQADLDTSAAEEEGWDAAVLQGGGRDLLFAPKTICVISRFPIYGVMRRFLRHLYAISLSETQVPLERYISMFVSCIPMPAPGGRQFHVYLEPLESSDPRRSRLKPLNLHMPPYPWLPLMDMDFSAPFRCLSVDSVLCIFSLMLQEAKILFLSSRAELLTQVMEAMRSLIFPLDWQSVYVPRLPRALSGCLECPGGFLIGMHLTRAEMAAGTASLTLDLCLRGIANAVNLDIGEILLSTGEVAGCLFPNDPRSFLHSPVPGTNGGEAVFPRQRREEGAGSGGFLNWLGGCGCGGGSSNAGSIYGAPNGGDEMMRRNTGRASTDGGKSSGGSSRHHQNSIDEEPPMSALPEPLRSDIGERLKRELFEKCNVRVGREEDLDQYESAFEFAPVPGLSDGMSELGYSKWRQPFAAWIKAATQQTPMQTQYSGHFHSSNGSLRTQRGGGFSTAPSAGEFEANLVVRDTFICCMAELLGGIGSFVRRSEVKRSRHSLRTRPLDELFNMSDFLAGLSPPVRPFVQRLTGTQMFWVLVQQWLESSEKDEQLVFFEECVMALKSRRAGGVIPYRDDGVMPREGMSRLNRTGTEADDPIPLVDEVRLKRPDLYGYAPSHPPRLGNVATPLATPSSSGKQAAQVTAHINGFGPGMGDDASTASGASLISPAGDGPVLLPGSTLGHSALSAVSALGGTLDSTGLGLSPRPRERDRDRHVAFAADSSEASSSAHSPYRDRDRNGGGGGSSSGISSFALLNRLDSALLDSELHLMDNGASPIIIPGPAPEALLDGPISYPDGWPTPLDRDLLKMPPEALPPVVLKLQSFSAMHHRLHSRRQAAQGAPIGTRLMYGEFEPMVVVPLEALKAAKAIPRSSEAARTGALVSYASLSHKAAKRRNSLVLFISHRWQQARALPPHPDLAGVTYGLLCAGVEKLLQGLPPTTKAYLWIDFCCIDQDDMKRRRRGIRSLPSYVERCDAMLIPYTADGGGSGGNSGGVRGNSELDSSCEAPNSSASVPRAGDGLSDLLASAEKLRGSPALIEEPLAAFSSLSGYNNAGSLRPYSATQDSPVPGGSGSGAAANAGFSSTHSALGAASSVSGGGGGSNSAGLAGVADNPFAGAWDNGWPARYPSLAHYSSRAWCRAELYMGSNVPILPDGLFYFDVVGMAHRSGDRPVFVYGPEQHGREAPPAMLPRLDKSWFRRVNPVEGFLTQESDRREIFALIERVQCATPAPPKPGYKGQQRLWRPHGKGRMVFEDGRVYEGGWKNGKMGGIGVMHYSRGSRYEGEWRAGKKVGKGSMTYPDGARYDGQWLDGRRRGMGTYVYASGAVYEGEWEDGKMHGSGCYTSASGSRYQGKYVRGKRHGHGTMEYGDGRTYVGEWKGGVRNGEGTYFMADGGRFEGTFRRDKKHGPGLLFRSDGSCVEQDWNDGRLVGESEREATTAAS